MSVRNQKGRENLGYCPFRRRIRIGVVEKDCPCSVHCALFVLGIRKCVFVAINSNLGNLAKDNKQKGV